MAKWEQLIAARDQKHLSQMEAAERLNVGLVTYQRWELGQSKPQPQHMRHICEVFGTCIERDKSVPLPQKELFHVNGSDSSSVIHAVSALSTEKRLPIALTEDTGEICTFLTANLTSRLWSLAFMDHPTCNEKCVLIRQAIEEFDSMNIDNKNYQITRREALWSLATLPMITLGLMTPGKSVPSSQYGSVLAHCAASLEPCWELYRSSDPTETSLAFKCSSKYVSILQAISQDSPSHRKEALDLATRYALVKTLLGWICAGPAETLQYAKDAAMLSDETGDISLQLSAYSKLAWAYFYLKKNGPALSIAQKAQALLTRYTLSANTQPLHPCVYGGTYSTLALMQAKSGQSPDSALGKALEADPEGSFAFMDSKRITLFLEAGMTYCYAGNQAKAMEMLAKRVNPDTLKPRLAQSAMGYIETINVMALSSLRTKDRDMEKIIHFWRAGVEGARSLQNEQRFNEILTAYELMEAIWPNEKRVTELREHLVHWEE